jgi:hypothetical protein
MQNTTGAFGLTASAKIELDIAVGSYAQKLEYNGPVDRILRIDGVGEFIVPDEVISAARARVEGKDYSEQEAVRVFLREILSSKFEKLR